MRHRDTVRGRAWFASGHCAHQARLLLNKHGYSAVVIDGEHRQGLTGVMSTAPQSVVDDIRAEVGA